MTLAAQLDLAHPSSPAAGLSPLVCTLLSAAPARPTWSPYKLKTMHSKRREGKASTTTESAAQHSWVCQKLKRQDRPAGPKPKG